MSENEKKEPIDYQGLDPQLVRTVAWAVFNGKDNDKWDEAAIKVIHKLREKGVKLLVPVDEEDDPISWVGSIQAIVTPASESDPTEG